MRCHLVAASEKELSPMASSSPRVRRPGCPPGREKWQSPVSRAGISPLRQRPHQPCEIRDRKARNQRAERDRHPEKGTGTRGQSPGRRRKGTGAGLGRDPDSEESRDRVGDGEESWDLNNSERWFRVQIQIPARCTLGTLPLHPHKMRIIRAPCGCSGFKWDHSIEIPGRGPGPPRKLACYRSY